MGRAALQFAAGHATFGLLSCEQFVTGCDCLLRRWNGQKKMDECSLPWTLTHCLAQLRIAVVELHNLIWVKFFLSLPAAWYRLSRALEAPACSGQCCGPGSGDHSLPLSGISNCGAEYLGVKHSAFFVLVFCQNQPSFLPLSLPPAM